MEKDTEKAVNTAKKKRKIPGVPFTKNDPRINRNGRPLNTKNFYTDFKEAIRQIKDKNTGEELTETHIIKIGLEKMLKGDARFEGLYKDLMDRVYGKPVNTVNVDATIETTDGLTKEQKEGLLNLLK